MTPVGIFAVQHPRKRAGNLAATGLIQQYLRTGDARLFHGQPVNPVPWPGGEEQVAEVLSDPTVRTFLPVSLCPPDSQPAYPVPSRLSRFALAPGWLPLLLGGPALASGLLLARRGSAAPAI